MTKKCPQCNQDVPDYSKFCPHCSYAFDQTTGDAGEPASVVVCSVCGEFNDAKNKFCRGCGAPLTGKEEVPVKKKVTAPTPLKKKIKIKKVLTEQGINKKIAGIVIPGNRLLLIFGVLVIAGIIILVAGGTFSSPAEKAARPQQMPVQTDEQIVPDLAQQPKIDSLEKLVKADPGNKELQLQYARALDDARFYDRAITEYKKYVNANPTNPDAIVDLGVCYFNLRNLDQAETLFTSALKLNPEHIQALYNLGIINLRKEKPDEAAKWFNKVIETAPESQEAVQAKSLLQSHSKK